MGNHSFVELPSNIQVVFSSCWAWSDDELTNRLGRNPLYCLTNTNIFELRVVDKSKLSAGSYFLFDFQYRNVFILQQKILQVNLWVNLFHDIFEALSKAVVGFGRNMWEACGHLYFQKFLILMVDFMSLLMSSFLFVNRVEWETNNNCLYYAIFLVFNLVIAVNSNTTK